jgi:hypothetical protein
MRENMTGGQFEIFWEANRCEPFVEYILSSVASVVRVPHEGDFGYDLLCTILRKEEQLLIAEQPFNVQVKKNSEDIVYGKCKKGKWKKYEVDWLQKQEQPLFIASVDIESLSLNLFSTHHMWFVFQEVENPGQIVFVFNQERRNITEAGPISIEEYKKPLRKNFRQLAGDGFCYRIPLGKPFCTIELEQLVGDKIGEHTREYLRSSINQYIQLENYNINNYKKNIPISYYQERRESCVYEIRHFIPHKKRSDQQISNLLSTMQPAITYLFSQWNSSIDHYQFEKLLPIIALIEVYCDGLSIDLATLMTLFSMNKDNHEDIESYKNEKKIIKEIMER